MAPNCVACGKLLGASSGLCHSCRSDGVALDDELTVDESVKERVERYFVVSSVRSSECGDIHGEVTLGEDAYTADDFGIEIERTRVNRILPVMSNHSPDPGQETDRLVSITDSRNDERYISTRLEDGRLLLYDRANTEAWLTTDASIDLAEVT